MLEFKSTAHRLWTQSYAGCFISPVTHGGRSACRLLAAFSDASVGMSHAQPLAQVKPPGGARGPGNYPTRFCPPTLCSVNCL